MAQTGAARQNSFLILMMAAVLIGGLVSAVMIPAGEFPPRGYAIFSLCIDAAMAVILGFLVMAERGLPQTGLTRAAVGLGAVGVVAGLVQVAIRFTSDHAWWTGHYLPPVIS